MPKKLLYKVYITYRTTNGSASGIDVTAGVNGGTDSVTFSASTSKFAGTSTDCYTSSNLVDTGGVWKIAELKFGTPSEVNNIYSMYIQLDVKSSTQIDTGFEVNDISIVYRTKNVK